MTGTATTTTTSAAKATTTAPPTSSMALPSMARLVLQQITAPQATARIIPATTATASETTSAAAIAIGTTATNDAPLFEVKLELTETEIRFSPAFDASVENNFQQIVEQLLLDIKQTCDSMPRIVSDNSLSDDDDDAAENEGKFMQQVCYAPAVALQKVAPYAPRHAMLDVSHSLHLLMPPTTFAAAVDDLEMLCASIRDALSQTVQAALNYAAKFHAYAFLWTQQSGDVLASCMQTAREQTTHISGSGYAIMETFKKEVRRTEKKRLRKNLNVKAQSTRQQLAKPATLMCPRTQTA